ncbi:hypothetical protein RSOLAG22IIIB_12938 [Rhizoctonia solani]|uniref:Uncharacterized protein n=1 Tax=Rhizoctonia solani TaxID=456999 RepID=A0A0K6GHJ7_9AGAM|nr:hypothetical protein RSOLAG22IIIB_12938 [Rhizoctonia solani]
MSMTDGTTFCNDPLPELRRDFMNLDLNRAPSAAGPSIHQRRISRDPAVSGSQCQSEPSIDEFFLKYPYMVPGAPWPAHHMTFDTVAEAAIILEATHPELLELASSIPVTAEALDPALDLPLDPALATALAPQLAVPGYFPSVTDVQSEQEPHDKRKRTSIIMSVDSNQGPSCKSTQGQAGFVSEEECVTR